MDMNDTLLAVRELRVKYGDQTVLNVSAMDVKQGEVLAVIGPNGAGKSTFLLVMARLLEPTQGEIYYRGSPLGKESNLSYRRRIALVLQEPFLMHKSVFENVAAGLRFRGLPRTEVQQRTNDWLERLQISHLYNRPAQRLSGGEAQRTSLARAFVLQPELLLLDEPFSALDAPTRAHLLQDLHALLSETAITTIFITHDLDEALLLGDRVAVLLGGTLRQVGRPQEVFTAPNDAEVAAFVGVETVISGRVSAQRDGQVVVCANGLDLEAVGDLPIGTPVYYCLRPEDITLSTSNEVAISSARNRIRGRISHMTPSGPLVRVVIDCGLPIVALVTRSSVIDLKLTIGQIVTASFKATAVHMIPC